MKPKLQRTRTASVFIMYFALGFHEVVIGPALVDFEILYNTDTKTMGIIFVVHQLAYLTGSVICGCVIDKYNQELLLALATMSSAIVIAGSPWLGNVFAFIFCFGTLKGICGGFVETAGETYLTGLWLGTKYQAPFMQFLHFAWSLSATIVPLILQPFLAKRLDGDYVTSNYTDIHMNSSIEGITNLMVTQATPITTNVRYGFMVVGGLIFTTSLFPLAVFFINTPTIKPLPFIKAAEDVKGNEDKSFKIKMLLMTFIYFFFDVGMEITFGGLVSTYVIRGLKWDKYKGPLITSVFWGIFGISRLVSVPVSSVLKPTTMIVLSLSSIVVSLLTMVFCGHLHEGVVWAASGVFGFAIGPLFPSGVLWTSRYILLDGRSSAVITVGSCAGSTIFPALTAYLFNMANHQWLLYIVLGEGGIALVVFIAMNVVAVRHGELLQKIEISKDVNGKMLDHVDKETGSVHLECKSTSDDGINGVGDTETVVI